jgi:predicted transcriptional regulator
MAIVTRVGTQVQLDDALLGRIDELAHQLGRSRDELIEDSLRREVAGRLLERVFARTRGGDELTAEQAAELAYSELDAMRAEPDGQTGSG